MLVLEMSILSLTLICECVMEILKPIVHETIWGGSRLSNFAKSDSLCIGHLYSLIDTSEFCSVITGGCHKGETIHDWFLANREHYGLASFVRFPFILAILDANEDLSIQVHPKSKIEFGNVVESGKNESFFVMEKPSSGSMWCGCKSKNIDEFNYYISQGRLDEVVDRTELDIDDYIYIPGGTLHASTSGGLYFEIEENSGKTYRFYDYDRVDSSGKKRQLQLKEAQSCLDINSKGIKRKPGKWLKENSYATCLLRDKYEITNEQDIFYVAVLLRGETVIEEHDILPGTAILFEPGEKLKTGGLEWMLARPLV